MAKTGSGYEWHSKRVSSWGEARDVWRKPNGDLIIINPNTRQETIIGNDEMNYQDMEPGVVGEGVPEGLPFGNESDMLQGVEPGMIPDDSMLEGLIEPKAHDSIDEIIQDNDLSEDAISRMFGWMGNITRSQREGNTLYEKSVAGHPWTLDSIGEALASKLIGQDPETGEIPAHKWGMDEEQLRNQRIEKYRRYGINKGGFKEYSDEPSQYLKDLFKEGKIY